ncbi:acyl carrier protein [Nocardia sp. NPDC050793]|uniref:acyl carrier protein n=1 Tax=Nocardia sp. NPDC050793 TaxID=3155159 RepID=UPI0033E9C4AC
MTYEEALELVIGAICGYRGIDRSEVNEATNMVDDLGFDSIDAAELVVAIYTETGWQLDPGALRDIEIFGRSVEDVAASVVSRSTKIQVS